ncbi:MAG: VWA domain-containing protein [Phycisphaerales bacterium]|nr:VWA domain-containing protein [Phycisphaerales bacterium]
MQPALQWPLERVSPLASAPPRPPPLSITFLLDASGSMASHVASSGGASRFGLALHSAAIAAQLLSHNSNINVLAFSGRAQLLFRGHPAAFHAALAQLQQRVRPTGPTNPDTALSAIRRVARVGSMFILITDGQIPKLNVSAWTQLIDNHHLRFTVIAPPGESPALRSLLAQTHAQHLAAVNPMAWSVLLHRAVAQVLFGQVHHAIIPWSAPQLNLSGQTNLWTQTWLKAGAQQIALSQTPKAMPLAAVWRVGLGKVAALCFQGETSDFSSLLEALIQRVVPSPADNRFNVTARRDVDHWSVEVNAMANGRFLNRRHLTLRIISPDIAPPPHSFQLNQVAPGQYNCKLPRSIESFVAVLSEDTNAHSRRFISVVSPPELPARIWPATLGDIPPRKLHAQVLPIGSLATHLPYWHPTGLAHRLSLAPMLWILAALLGLLSLAWTGFRRHL